jgi:predicted RNA methylase
MQDMAPFDPARLKVQLEQYPTGPDIASRMLFTVRRGAAAAPGFRLRCVLARTPVGTGACAASAGPKPRPRLPPRRPGQPDRVHVQ